MIIIAVCVGFLLFVVLSIIAIVYCVRRRRQQDKQSKPLVFLFCIHDMLMSIILNFILNVFESLDLTSRKTTYIYTYMYMYIYIYVYIYMYIYIYIYVYICQI